MKNITKADVEKLRAKIRQGHDRFMDEFNVIVKTAGQEKQQMLQRLEKAAAEVNALLERPDECEAPADRVRGLFREINELRVYFGAPTGRPLEDRGVDFIDPYIQSLRLLFQFDRSMLLYVEMIRTELALLEYRLERGQDVSDRLASLAENVELLEKADEFRDVEDIRVADLRGYLLDIYQLLMPLLYDRAHEALHVPLTRVYIAMGAAFAVFDCMPEEPDEYFITTMIVSMMIQLMPSEPDPYTAVYCQTVAQMLWGCPLSDEQKEDVAGCYQKAQEVLGDA